MKYIYLFFRKISCSLFFKILLFYRYFMLWFVTAYWRREFWQVFCPWGLWSSLSLSRKVFFSNYFQKFTLTLYFEWICPITDVLIIILLYMDIEVQAFLRPSWLRPGRESNSRPDAYKSGALPSKLTKLAVLLVFIMSIINIKEY